MMKRKLHTTRPLPTMLALALFALASLVACHNDNDEDPPKFLIEYGTIEKINDVDYVVRLDKGPLLLPVDTTISGRGLKNEMRVDIDYTILDDAPDATLCDYLVAINYLNEIPTFNIIPASEATSADQGSDPVDITQLIVANGFLTIEFLYEASDLSDSHRFTLVLQEQPTTDNRRLLSFHHDNGGDTRGTSKFGHVSFRLQDAFPDTRDSIPLLITHDGFDGPSTHLITYHPRPYLDNSFQVSVPRP